MYDIPFDRSFLQLSNGIRRVMPSTDTKPELTAEASMAQPVSQPALYANGLIQMLKSVLLKCKKKNTKIHSNMFRIIRSIIREYYTMLA
jgi:hypothetical protein